VELLQIIRVTENDDLTNVLQKLVCNFVSDVAPIAHEISLHLTHTFQQIMEGSSDLDGKTLCPPINLFFAVLRNFKRQILSITLL